MKFWDGCIKISLLFVLCFTASINLHAQSKANTPLKLITFNIRYDNANDGVNSWSHRSERVKQFLKSEDADIIGLQEALYNQVSELDAFLSSQAKSNYLRIGVGREDGKTKGEFAPIYFKQDRFQLLKQDYFWLSETPDKPSKGWDAACERIATVAMLFDLKSLDTLVVVNSHWDHVGITARAKSAEMISNYIKKIATNAEVFVMGDFNSVDTDSGIVLLRENLFDSCPSSEAKVGTFNGFNHDLKDKPRIDYVLYRTNHFTHQNYRVFNDKDSVYVSDHYAVVSEFQKHQIVVALQVKFVYDKKPLESIEGLTVKNLKCYIGDITGLKDHSTVVGIDPAYHLIDYSNPTSQQFDFVVNQVPDQFRITLGVDSITNSEGVHGGDLDPTKGMYWSWQSGYIQFKFEGSFKGKEYSLHLGGFENAKFSSREHVSLVGIRIALPQPMPPGNSKPVVKNTVLTIDIKPLLDAAVSKGITDLMSPSSAVPLLMDALEKGIYVVRTQ